MFLAIIKQELKLVLRKVTSSINPLIFFIITISVFNLLNIENIRRNPDFLKSDLALNQKESSQISSNDNEKLSDQKISNKGQSYINISAIWFCLIFSIILGSNNFLKQDFEDGSLEQLLLSGNPFSFIIFAKIFANWLIYSLPIIISIPVISLILGLESKIIIYLTLSAIITTIIVNLFSCFASSLVLLSHSGSSLLTILILPMTIPIIIFANNSIIDYQSFLFSIKILFALFIFLLPIMILGITLAVKTNLE